MMTTEALFQIANTTALVGWIILLLGPLSPKWTNRVAGYAIPIALSVLYTGLILAFWFQAEGGFDTLANVQMLFTSPEAALAGWVHFLAFDLFLGGWEARRGRAVGMRHWVLIPCFALTFMFGPIGLLLFLALRFAHTSSRPAAA